MPLNECIAYYDEGEDLTGQVTAAVTGRRFLDVSGAKQAGSQGLANDTLGGSILVAHCGAGLIPIGVSGYDQPNVGGKVPVLRGEKVVPVEAGGAINPGSPVSSDATGRAVAQPGAAPNAVAGKCLNNPTAAGQIAIVALNL